MTLKDFARCFIFCVLTGIPVESSYAQEHAPEIVPTKWLSIADEQFQLEHFELAIQAAEHYLLCPTGYSQTKAVSEINKAEYYIAVSRLKINNPEGVLTALKLISATHVRAYRQRTAFALAQYYFRHNRFAAAIPFYQTAGIANLSNEEIGNSKFELAYCYFNTRQLDKAAPLFASIKELQTGKYYAAGNYYYGLLAYNENNYDNALSSFNRIKDLPQYRSIIPYYIAEIYYFTGNREKALNESVALVNRQEKSYYDNELHLLAAQCFFEEQRFKEAIPYFEIYYNNVDKIRKEDLYEMAYCYYRNNQWQQAIDKFKFLSSTKDSLGQTAMYLLGDAYLKTGDKKSGRNAFGFCSDMPFNPAQQETSILLYAKLSYEMGYNGDAAGALKNLLANFKNSKYRDEARTLLSDLLVKTNNYYEAYLYLLDVKDRGNEYWKVYQKVAYGYALQQAEMGNITNGDSLLATTIQHSEDPEYEAAAYFWRGELAYRLKNYNNTIRFSEAFLNKKASEVNVRKISAVATKQHAWLNMGYSAMEENDYSNARKYFNEAQLSNGSDATESKEALLHEADAVFMIKDYTHAAILYDKIIADNGTDADYARFQRSILYGLQRQTGNKVALLQQLVNKGALSTMSDAARYELGVTYIETNRYKEAITLLLPLTTMRGPSALPAKALLKTGFAYQQLDDNQNAITTYKNVVVKYPASEERPAALEALKNLYIENDQPAAYAQFLNENNLSAIDNNSLDSTYYHAAETQFATGKWDKAKESMSKYISQFPGGIFITKAQYYRAESNYMLKNNDAALVDYDKILQGPLTEYSENSAKRASVISYHNNDYKSAQRYFTTLRSITRNSNTLLTTYAGLMKSCFYLDKFDASSQHADTLIALSRSDSSLRSAALLYKGKNLEQLHQDDSAMLYFVALQNNSDNAIAAEALYHIAEYQYKQNNLKEAEKVANATINKSVGLDYWIIKSYILLSDILVKEKDYFNAKATLQSIVKNASIPELKQEASRKLEQVKALERKQSKLSEE